MHIQLSSLLPRLMGILLKCLLLMGMYTSSAQAGYYVLNHNNTNMNSSNGDGIVVAMPGVDNGRIQINRIRLTRSGTTDVSHLFVFATTADASGDTESITTCTLPTCRQVLTTEGLREGRSYDYDGLDLLGPPNGRVDAVRTRERQVRQTVADTDAVRMVLNERLDHACLAFGDELLTAVRKDRTSSRWLQFFATPPSRFIRQGLNVQVTAVRGWLASSSDPVLANHKDALEKWSVAADQALVSTAGLSSHRSELWQEREKLVAELTQARDVVWRKLADRALERGLPRTWPDVFFRVESRASQASSPESGAQDSASQSAPEEGSSPA